MYSSLNALLLTEAVLCADCEMISNSVSYCRCCGSTAVMNLSQLLGGSLRNVERAVLLDWPGAITPVRPSNSAQTRFKVAA